MFQGHMWDIADEEMEAKYKEALQELQDTRFWQGH